MANTTAKNIAMLVAHEEVIAGEHDVTIHIGHEAIRVADMDNYATTVATLRRLEEVIRNARLDLEDMRLEGLI